MDPISFEEAAPQLVEVIRSRTATLILGAGASFTSGAPLGAGLVARLREKFPLADIDPQMSFLDAGTNISNTPPYGRKEIIDFLREEFEILQPASEYKQLPRWNWRAIFTTNYDDLIEKSYKTPGRLQTLQPVHLPYDTATIPRENHLYLFYLQGSITKPAHNDASPVVTWGDYHRTVQDRVSVMNLLRNVLIDGGRVIYLGYSFNDFFLDGLLDEASRRLGNQNMPYGYAILPDWPTDFRKRHKITRHNIIPVIGTFEDFSGLITQIADHGYQRALDFDKANLSPAAGYTIRAGAHALSFTESEFGVYSEFFDILDESRLHRHAMPREEEVQKAKEFLKGEITGWAPYAREWAFKREKYAEILTKVRETLNAVMRPSERVILVHGPAGLGKSVMARQIAYDLAHDSNVPVLIAKPSWRVRPDVRLLDRFFDDLEEKLPETEVAPSVVLILDEAELVDRALPARVARYLVTKGRSVVVVLFARTNEYYRPVGSADTETPARWGDPHVLSIPESMTDAEITSLVQHIQKLGVWQQPRITDKNFWIDYVRREHSSSFFDTVYALVEETQTPLSTRVRTEYDNLGDVAKRAYQLIAAVHQFGIPLKLEILMRAINVGWPTFEKDVIRGDAREVLFAEQLTSDLNVNFRGRTRLISELVFSHAVPDHEQQLEVYRDLVRSFNPGDMFGADELDTLRTLLVQVFGPSGFDDRFSTDEVSSLFEIATSLVEDDVLEHHFGLIERDARRLVSARMHLEKALSLISLLPDDMATQRESPQNVENSLADVIGNLAMEALSRGAPDSAESLFQEAARHFQNARRGVFPNAAAYDAHARLMLRRARKRFALGDPTRALALSDTIDVLDDGIDNVNEEHRPDLAQLKSEVLQELGLESNAVAELAQKAETAGNSSEAARYHVIIARILVGSNNETKRKKLRNAYSHAVQACELDHAYFPGQRIRIELFKILNPTDVRGLNALLREAARCPDASDNHIVQYELGVTEFELDRYAESAMAFARLRRISRGSALVAGVIEVAGERSGDAFEFTGTIVKNANGKFAVESDVLKQFQPLWFNPRTERFYTPRLRDSVSFRVGFNYRGPLALELRRQ
jgi:hypothetical protein